jgi:hypothetical protein
VPGATSYIVNSMQLHLILTQDSDRWPMGRRAAVAVAGARRLELQPSAISHQPFAVGNSPWAIRRGQSAMGNPPWAMVSRGAFPAQDMPHGASEAGTQQSDPCHSTTN